MVQFLGFKKAVSSFLPLQSKKVFHNPKNFISRWFSFGYALFLPFFFSARPVCFSGDFGGLVLGVFGGGFSVVGVGGRFFAVDPLSAKYPFYSSYQFSSNSPIIAIELEGLESSVILNYPELSVTLDINENGIIYITNDKFLQLQKNKYAGIRNETGSFYKDFKHYIEVPCYDCGVRNNYGTIAKIGIVIYSNDVIREMEVGSTPFNRYGGQDIKINNKALNVKDYNSKGISTDNINQAVNNLLNRANSDLNDVPVNAQGISLTIFVNSDLSTDKQNSIKTQVENKFSVKTNVNIDFNVFDYSESDDNILLQYNIEADVPQKEDVTIPPIEFLDD